MMKDYLLKLRYLNLHARIKNLFTPDFEEAVTPKPLPNSFFVSICCIAKDENAYLEEWMNYYLKIGVEHFYFYDNESKVPILETLKKLGLDQYATVTRVFGRAKQNKAYMNCIHTYGETSHWIAFVDMDEFIVPKQPKGDLQGFLKDYESYGGVGVNWLFFGSSGHKKRTHRPQLESFVLRAEESFPNNRHIKSIVQPKYVQDILNAHSFTYKDGRYCVNENFMRVDGAFSDLSVNRIQLNHYYCRSVEEYEEKIKRGVADTLIKRTIKEFLYHDKEANKVQDTTILEILNQKQ